MDHSERPAEALVVGSVRRRPCVGRLGQWLVLAMRQMDVIVVVPKDERPTGVEARVGLTGVLRVNGSSLYDSAQRSVLPFRGLALKPLARAAEETLDRGNAFAHFSRSGSSRRRR